MAEEKDGIFAHANELNQEEVLAKLKQDKTSYEAYLRMNEEWKKHFIDFCTGKKSLPLLYDSTFKFIFNPEMYPERLGRFISSILGEEVKIKGVLLPEDTIVNNERAVIMDIVVELKNGAIADVEIQKNPYLFEEQRISCYSSDSVIRQYMRLKKLRGKRFKYNDMSKVYTIVIYEKSSTKLKDVNGSYIHHGKVKFDTGIKLDLLQEYHIITLDAFKENAYHKEENELCGWLSLLVTEDMEDVEYVIKTFPWLQEIYEQIAAARTDIQGVMEMHSQMFAEADESTLRYVVDDYEELVNDLRGQLESQQEQIASKDEQITSQQERITSQQERITALMQQISELRHGDGSN